MTPRTYTKSRSRTTTNRQRATTRKTGVKHTPKFSINSPAYKRAKDECERRIGSYRTIYQQFTGAGMKTTFSPTNAAKWLKFVNNGYCIYKWSNKDFCKYFGNQWQNASPTTCYRWMRQKYGSGIKAVTRGKANSWLVATTPNVTARPFSNYHWK